MLLLEQLPDLDANTIFSVAVGGIITLATGTGVHLWEASKSKKNELISAATEIRDILTTFLTALRQAARHMD